MPSLIVKGGVPLVPDEKKNNLKVQLAAIQQLLTNDDEQSWIDVNNSMVELLKDFSNGTIITKPEAERRIRNFGARPLSYTITASILKQFLSKVNEMEANVPEANELGFRYYIGRKSVASDYFFVIVPMVALRNIADVRDHLQDLEKTFLLDTEGNFFIALTSTGKISYDIEECKRLISYHEMDGMHTRAVYYSKRNFEDFLDGLIMAPRYFAKLRIDFAKMGEDAKDKITMVQKCLTVDDVEIESRAGASIGIGVYFDEGDLIPPPPVEIEIESARKITIPDSIFD